MHLTRTRQDHLFMRERVRFVMNALDECHEGWSVEGEWIWET